MRNHKSPSCIERPTAMTSYTKKYYSTEQVMQILRNTMSQKLNKLYQQLQQKQHAIKILNEKLNENDKKLQQQTRIIESIKIKNRDGNAQVTLNMINKILNDKIQNYWNNIEARIQELRRNITQQIQMNNNKLDKRMQLNLKEIREKVNEEIDTFKKKNNAYWLKVKEAFNKLNAKEQGIEEKIGKIAKYSQKYQQDKKYNVQLQKQLQSGKKITKSFRELKKSIQNVYQNYKEMLSMQNTVKGQLEQNCSLSIICDQNMKKPRTQPDIVILEYSKQQDNDSYKQTGLTEDYYGVHKRESQLSPLKISKSLKKGKQQDTSLWSFNNDVFMHSRTVNLSMDSRKQMTENIRERLLEMIKVKNLEMPLTVTLDKVSNLKNEEGHIIFDLTGTMFKINGQIFNELEGEGILLSKGKVTGRKSYY